MVSNRLMILLGALTVGYLYVRRAEIEELVVTKSIDVSQATLTGFDEVGIREGYGN